jgi:histidinol phosphate phosphatase HisJ family
MYSDFHVHSEFSSDSNAPIRGQIEQAIKLGMNHICITDHHDYNNMPIEETEFFLNTDNYFSVLTKLKLEYANRINMHIGVELGLQTCVYDYNVNYTSKYPFEVIIGSIHCLKGLDPYYPEYFEGRSEEESYREYFEITLENVKLFDCYDVLGHLDYIVRYGPNKSEFYSYLQYKDIIDEILKEIIYHGKGIECNTSGFRYGLGLTNPHFDIIKRYVELGGEILTLGSDSHYVQDIGYRFDYISDYLKKCGLKYYTIFSERKPEFIRL